MHKELDSWYSPSLNKEMEIVTYGHMGFSLLLIPTAAADYLEYERFLMIDALSDQINAGKVKVFSINSINSESWMNTEMEPAHKAIRHNQFNSYVENEVIPYLKTKSGEDTPIIACGASLGALHSANLFFRRPDIIDGVIAMSGVYDLKTYTDGYWDDQVYFNSPMHYLENLSDDFILPRLQKADHIHILCGSGDYEKPQASQDLSALLSHKNIPHDLDVWGPDMTHDWPTWRAMLPFVIDSKF